jgi:hypothetical protein
MRFEPPEKFEPCPIPIEYGLPLVHVTESDVLPVTAADVSAVPAVAGNVSVAALIVHDAVMVIWTVRLAVAVPACAAHGQDRHEDTSNIPKIRLASLIIGGTTSDSRAINET